jgi:hypothetical protein
MDIALIIAGLAVYLCLLITVHRQHVRRHLRWFVYYVFWEVLVQCQLLVGWLISHALYARLYWWIEAGEIVLTSVVTPKPAIRGHFKTGHRDRAKT